MSSPETMEPMLFPISERAASLARLHIGVTTSLLALALTMFGLRIWIRMRKVWRINIEDHVMFVGVCLAIVDFAFLLPQMRTSPTMITPEEFVHNQKYSFLAIPIWGLAMTFIKISIAMTLLRIQPTVLWWRIFFAFIMFILAAYGVGNTFFILLQCRPLEASWNPAILMTVEGSCLPLSAIMIASNTGAGVNISTDILLSLAPVMFLWKLKRPLREKLVVGGLMGLGIFASISSIMKTIVVSEFTNPNVDGFALGVSTATWTMMEQLLAMIAASAPFLKPLLQSALMSMGFSLNSTDPGRYGASSYHRATDRSTFPTGQAGRGEIRMTRSSAAANQELEDDDSPFAKDGMENGSGKSSEEAVELEMMRSHVQHKSTATEDSLSRGETERYPEGDRSWFEGRP